jgi:predicted outer membrane protein
VKHIAEGVRAAQEEALQAKAARGHAFDHLWMHEEVASVYRTLSILAYSVSNVAASLLHSGLDIPATHLSMLQTVVEAMQEIGPVLEQAEESAGEGIILMVERRNENGNGAG